MADTVPVDIPSQSELWRRVRLATSILNHRKLAPKTTADLLRRVLDGDAELVEDARCP